jgi:hypothetical protein
MKIEIGSRIDPDNGPLTWSQWNRRISCHQVDARHRETKTTRCSDRHRPEFDIKPVRWHRLLNLRG